MADKINFIACSGYNADNRKQLRRKYESSRAQGEEAANSLLGTDIPCPRVEVSEFNAMHSARYNTKEQKILVNGAVFGNNNLENLKEKLAGTFAHEMTHHIQHTLFDSDNYLDSACKQFKTAIKEATVKATLRYNEENLNTKVIAEYIKNNDAELFKQNIDRLVGEEALAYFVGTYASISANKSTDMCMKRAAILRSLMFRIQEPDLINSIFNKEGITSSFIKDINNGIWGFNGKMDETGKIIVVGMARTVINGEPLIPWKIINSGMPYKIAILAFAENGFSVLKTAQFLSMPYEEVVKDLQKAEAAFSSEKIDKLYTTVTSSRR
ncbi:hypothetical protein M1141_01010 [Candidatus Marsarchaeota archaeon]|nr:hypothetical protein [Candidatus Marsarchaeota archaeon]